METLPFEIWGDIFSFACTDDGSTGRSLSAVSRAVHSISKPLKYQSICVVGPTRLLKLLGVLSALSSDTRRVRYLFIAGPFDFEGGSDGVETLHADSMMAEFRPSQESTDNTLSQILNLVSSTLFALHLHHTATARPSLLIEIELPALSELALHGPFVSSGSPSETVFPSLRKIHLAHFTFHPTNFLAQIVHAAPRLTHLRVPQRSFSMYDIQVALGILQPTVSPSDVTRLPRNLKKLVIEKDPIPNFLDSWASNIRRKQFMQKLQKIVRSDARVALVDGHYDWISVAQARDQWLDSGGC
ncbi:hypothetical protein B0H10DRAFT_1987531 [Mycena sp. CBHHK59/15]|nr:hypothetical protein B0H10DRAFT_1987531 [Mycena sp. CBHHK59/15]